MLEAWIQVIINRYTLCWISYHSSVVKVRFSRASDIVSPAYTSVKGAVKKADASFDIG